MKNKVLPLIATMLLAFVNLLPAQQTSNPQSGNINSTKEKRPPLLEDELKKFQEQINHTAGRNKNGAGAAMDQPVVRLKLPITWRVN